MKRAGLISIIVLAGLVAVLPLLWPRVQRVVRDDELVIAAVGPQSGLKSGHWREMRRGIALFLERANAERMIPHATIRLLERDDANQARLATKVAAELAEKPEVLLVLGHYGDDAALAAGDVYQKYGLPAITASSIAAQVTANNAWYFRTVPNSQFQGRFLVNYAQHALNKSSISIVYDDDTYGTALMEAVRDGAFAEGMPVSRRWSFTRDSENLQEQLQAIISELRALKHTESTAVFLATHEAEGVEIIRTINNPGTDYTILGPASFATTAFRDHFRGFLQEQVQPGYYSDGVYALTPYLTDVAPEIAREFRSMYLKAYGTEPSWIAAAYYDAARVAVEALKLAEIDADEPLFQKRRKIRSVLAGLSAPEVAVDGVTHPVYFTAEGDVEAPPYVGRYTQQRLLPASPQYQMVRDEHAATLALQQTLSGNVPGERIVPFGAERVLEAVQVVNAGIDVNSINSIDMRHARYMIDFYLWFRFHEAFADFDETAIHFLNALSPIALGPPVFEATIGHETVRTYHVRGEFTHPVDLRAYPFEQPTLRVALFHPDYPLNRLRYVPDVVGMRGSAHRASIDINPLSGWKLGAISSYQRVYQRAPAEPADDAFPEAVEADRFSEFITDIQLLRNGPSFRIKSLFPLAVLAACLYLVYFIPVDRHGTRLALTTALFLINVGYHYHIRQRFDFPVNTILGLETLIFTIYALVLTAMLFTLFNHRLHTQGRQRQVRMLKLGGRVAHLALMGLGVLWMAYAVAQNTGVSAMTWLARLVNFG